VAAAGTSDELKNVGRNMLPTPSIGGLEGIGRKIGVGVSMTGQDLARAAEEAQGTVKNLGGAIRDSAIEGLGGKAPVPSTYSSGPAVPPMEAKLRAKALGGAKTIPNKNYFNNMNTGG
jgi:hypothetical protein